MTYLMVDPEVANFNFEYFDVLSGVPVCRVIEVPTQKNQEEAFGERKVSGLVVVGP
jgi:hypothetical protein